MKFTNSKKILALLSFVTLITAFVLYKAGAFDKYINPGDPSLQTSPNGGAMNNNRADTVPSAKKDTTKKPPIMFSGSKSGPIITSADLKTIPPDSTTRLDSSQRKKIDSIVKSQGIKKTIMPSTKSAPVFKPAQQDQNELIRLIKMYQGDSAGLRKALERYFIGRN